MVVMNELDEKIKFYQDKKEHTQKLRKDVNKLKEEIVNAENEIETQSRIFIDLKNEEIGSVKFGDLLEKISEWSKIDLCALDSRIIVLHGIYADAKEDVLRYQNNNFNQKDSILNIKVKNGPVICNKELSMFHNLEEIQADGISLLDHCSLIPTICSRSDLVVSENIKDIICNFKLEAVDYNNYKEDSFGQMLPDVIRECLKEGLVIETNKPKIKELVK